MINVNLEKLNVKLPEVYDDGVLAASHVFVFVEEDSGNPISYCEIPLTCALSFAELIKCGMIQNINTNNWTYIDFDADNYKRPSLIEYIYVENNQLYINGSTILTDIIPDKSVGSTTLVVRPYREE